MIIFVPFNYTHAHMRILKRLDVYLLRAYLQLFAGTFFICLFIFLMQFTWRYVDELIGKGLSTEVLAKFFWYASLTLVPLSLPLAILLAALITFGNFGERLELLSMKAAGISLLRIFQPIFIFVLMLCGGSYYYQNKIGPEATKQMASLVWSMKQKSPELEIPEGTFYNHIPGYNIYVERKNSDTGILYGVMIYSTTDGYQDAQIILADSGRLQTTADRMHLMLTLYGGERFRNMQSQGGAQMMKASVPYMRETFGREVDLIPFDCNFNITDAQLFAGNAQTKDINAISKGIDSLTFRTDSLGRDLYAMLKRDYFYRGVSADRQDSLQIVSAAAQQEPFDSLKAHLSDAHRKQAWQSASMRCRQVKGQYEFRQLVAESDLHNLRVHNLEWHKKFTLSMACLIFFFIGAPLGAIIRKGGLGMPVVISVLIFIFYYIINVSGEKQAKDGTFDIFFGAWISSLVLGPLGVFLAYKANGDSAVFDMDGYRNFFRRLLGLRITRKLNPKEVIIVDPDYNRLTAELQQLAEDGREYVQTHHLIRVPNYFRIFFRYHPDTTISDLSDRLEEAVAELHNTRDHHLLTLLNRLPVLVPDAHTRPFRSPRKNLLTGLFLPLGLIFYFRIWRYRLRLRYDLEQIQKLVPDMVQRMEKLSKHNN